MSNFLNARIRQTPAWNEEGIELRSGNTVLESSVIQTHTHNKGPGKITTTHYSFSPHYMYRYMYSLARNVVLCFFNSKMNEDDMVTYM